MDGIIIYKASVLWTPGYTVTANLSRISYRIIDDTGRSFPVCVWLSVWAGFPNDNITCCLTTIVQCIIGEINVS